MQRQAATLLKELQAADGTDLIANPSVITADGRQCQMRAMDEQVIDGEKLDLGPMIDFVPAISGDKRTIDISLHAVINPVVPK